MQPALASTASTCPVWTRLSECGRRVQAETARPAGVLATQRRAAEMARWWWLVFHLGRASSEAYRWAEGAVHDSAHRLLTDLANLLGLTSISRIMRPCLAYCFAALIRGLQDSVDLVQCRYEDQSVVHVACKPHAMPVVPSATRPLQTSAATSIRRHSAGSSARGTPAGPCSRDTMAEAAMLARLGPPSLPLVLGANGSGRLPTHYAAAGATAEACVAPTVSERNSRNYDRVASMDRIDEICTPNMSMSARGSGPNGSGRLSRRSPSVRLGGTADSINLTEIAAAGTGVAKPAMLDGAPAAG